VGPEYQAKELTTNSRSLVTFLVSFFISDLIQSANPSVQTLKPEVRDTGRSSLSAACKGEINLIREGEQGAAQSNYYLPVRRRLERGAATLLWGRHAAPGLFTVSIIIHNPAIGAPLN
jgi:hypothetical protein